MKIMILKCCNDRLWYKNKVSNRYKVIRITKEGNYQTSEGTVYKHDAVEI